MFHIVLFEPEIPPNAGNVIRLAANAGASLHLIKPLGFSLEHRQLARAGLDYHDLADVRVHESWGHCRDVLAGARIFAFSTSGARRYDEVHFEPGDAFVFGPESRGLPMEWLSACAHDHVLRLPMRPGNRSLNLSNAVAVVVFEAWRQQGFAGSA
ncbi:MAG: tRNA (cytidine(34)-2'-O)-methyltransferase [Rhodocyclaceae bacterium]|jgi:tRNA (cytidine/uridine-2'-O-)-methyltransferase|nr:tRNA (cytidine(34)-2'-O)-methyltransferase [Rhodocyclaceae bacterium]MCL4756953.1 tRNA (cytidine(34)-2'-O)-methyltransferase [Rhodocyclaceae bacterium]